MAGLAGLLLVVLVWSGWSGSARLAGGERGPGTPSEAIAGTPIDDLLLRLLDCRTGPPGQAGCTAVVYVVSERMPLSIEGVPEARSAARALGAELVILDAAALEDRAARLPVAGDGAGARPSAPGSDGHALTRGPDDVVRELLGAGATVHHPALVVVRDGRPLGGAILGYKRAEAYRALVAERLAAAPAPRAAEAVALDASVATSTSAAPPASARGPAGEVATAWSRDYSVQGRPGAYFRSVPGRRTLAYEAGGRVQLLDLQTGAVAVGPGYIDFVPTPDGRMFVTPQRGNGGLAFYEAEEVFRAAAAGTGRSVEPVWVDRAMRDQYPSVGILSTRAEAGTTRVAYRVLTSWFDRIVYRDYEVTLSGPGRAEVRPLGEPIVACPTVSIPIMSPDGKELAGRDEGTATTRIFALEDGCRPLADLNVQSGKVAWSPDARTLAFAIPRGAVRDGGGTLWVGGNDPAAAGIFVYHRDSGRIERVTESDDAHRLAFPEFVGADSLAFQLAPGGARDESVFRLVCCVR